jgi:membrane-associated phospholipid phosphatase
MYHLLHDLDWVLALRSPIATAIATAFSWTGYTPFIMLFLPLGYWAWNKRLFTRLALFVFMSAVLNGLIKEIFQDPRPDAIYRLDMNVGDSYGLPSGHAQTAVVLWFWLAYESRKRWAWVFAAVLVVCISFSRLYLGVHDIEDIVMGLSLGVICLYFFRWTESASWDRWHHANWLVRIGVVLVVVAMIIYEWPHGPNTWILQTGGMLFGWFLGAVVERRFLGYRPSGELWRLVLSCVIGVASVSLLFLIKKYLGGNKPSPSISLMPFATATFLGAHITLVLPSLFCLFRLASPGEEYDRLLARIREG